MKGTNSIPRELMDSLMLSIVSFMNQAGMPATEIESSFREGMKELIARKAHGYRRGPRKTSTIKTSAIGCDTIAGAVLRAWHRDTEYLDELASPVPLALVAKGKSLTTLVASQDSDADVSNLVNAMLRTGLIKKLSGNRYLPRTSAATISQMHPFAVDHVVKTVLRLVETVTRNMRLVDTKPLLVERYAHVPDLDAKEARAFSEFSKQQGAACLEAIEDWLEARRKRKPESKKGGQPSVSAGMHVFAYLGQPAATPQKRPARRGKTTTSSRAARA